MKFILLFCFAALLVPIRGQSQNTGKPAAGGFNQPARFGNSGLTMDKTKTKPKDKKMGLASLERPEKIENPAVGNAFGTLESGDWDAAIDQLDDFAGKDADAAYGLGFAYFQDGQLDKAISAYQKAIQLDPNNLEALYDLGLVYEEKGEYAKAEAQFIRMLRIDAADTDAWYELGFLYTMADLEQDAFNCFNQVLAIDPTDPDAPFELCRLYAISGNLDKALEKLEQAFKNGFEEVDLLLEDESLEELRSTERFEELMAQYFPD